MKRVLMQLDSLEIDWMIKDYKIRTRKKFRQQLLKERIKKTIRLKDTVYSSQVLLAIAMLDRPSSVRLKQ